MLRGLSPVPTLYRGFPLHPDDDKDPYVFRIDLSEFGIGTGRVVFSREPGAGTRAVHLDLVPMSLQKRPATRGCGSTAPWLSPPRRSPSAGAAPARGGQRRSTLPAGVGAVGRYGWGPRGGTRSSRCSTGPGGGRWGGRRRRRAGGFVGAGRRST